MINGLIIYTKPDCTKCRMTKHYAEQLGFEYEVRDIFDQDNNMYDDVKQLVNNYGLHVAPIVIAVLAEAGQWSGAKRNLFTPAEKRRRPVSAGQLFSGAG